MEINFKKVIGYTILGLGVMAALPLTLIALATYALAFLAALPVIFVMDWWFKNHEPKPSAMAAYGDCFTFADSEAFDVARGSDSDDH